MSGRLNGNHDPHGEPTAADARPVGASAPALEAPSRLLPAILDGMGDGLVVADEAGRCLFFNAAARRILGDGPTDAPLDDWPLVHGLYRTTDGALFEPADLPLARALRGEESDQVEALVRNRACRTALLSASPAGRCATRTAPRGAASSCCAT